MYGHPSLGYGCEFVPSINAMINVIKHRQVVRPWGKFALKVAGGEIAVELLPNGWLELNGEVLSIAVEKRVEDSMRQHGAYLFEVLV